jgi:putative transcriptional regulator
MAVSYKRLWKLLVDKKMSKSDLRKKAEIAPNTMTKLRRDEEVSLTILSKVAIGICSIVAVAIAVKIFIWIKERNKLVKVSVKVENNDNR